MTGGTEGDILTVPGLHGSGPDHWQTWMEQQVPGARRIARIDWGTPVLARWAYEIRSEIECSPRPVWLIAHSFGCLAAVTAAAERCWNIAGALLVAPADPERFTPSGVYAMDMSPFSPDTVSVGLTRQPLPFPSIVVASANDPWMSVNVAACWADLWGSRFVNIGNAGHINAEAGFGPWPQGLELLQTLQRSRLSHQRRHVRVDSVKRRRAGSMGE